MNAGATLSPREGGDLLQGSVNRPEAPAFAGARLVGARRDFPGLVTPDGAPWHYLDTAATAQKPRVVIDAMSRALGADYATVHRGVYGRSAAMTQGYEAARRRVARFLGAAEEEVVFVRGATEAINLVAASWGGANIREGDRIVLSLLEHHSNIVPWQMLAERTGAVIDVCPLTEDGRIDLDALERLLKRDTKLVALAHVSNVLGSVLDARAAATLAHGVGAKLLLDGCQAAPRMALDMAALGCDFYAFSGHKLYGPTGIGVLWARAAAGRRGDDRERHFRTLDLCPAAAAVRGGDADDRRGDRASRRHRLCRCARPRSAVRA